ncbi:WYL domain-containing protein [Parvularcula marina]|uniref:WYL domain-containing protein n=1 Tax=Parvularcula marina TaxID=2292771 RepID=UPI003519423E
MAEFDDLKVAVRRRLEFIEFSLQWERRIGRKQLQQQFDISPQQATVDLTTYIDLFPENMIYDPRQRSYIPTKKFKAQLGMGNAQEYLRRLEAVARGFRSLDEVWLHDLPQHDVVSARTRSIDVRILSTVLLAIRTQQFLRTKYVSLSSETAHERRLYPTALASDGHRWHVRGFDCDKERYSDFVISRLESVSLIENDFGLIPKDEAWRKQVEVTFTTDPDLNDRQRASLEHEYQMKDGCFTIKIRQAMLFYYLRNYGFNPWAVKNGKMENRSSFCLRIINLDEVEKCLERR